MTSQHPTTTPPPPPTPVRSSLIIGNTNTSYYPHTTSPPQPTRITRAVMRLARARWFIFLRRVFHYQNGSSSPSSSNPLNSPRWMAMELTCLTTQIILTILTLSLSHNETPLWPMRIWIVGYDFACLISLLILYSRYHNSTTATPPPHHHDSTTTNLQSPTLTRLKSSLDLFYAMWFVMGNVWAFDARPPLNSSAFHQAPRLHALCVALLLWNGVCYAFPFILFLLLCVFLPLLSGVTGYNLNTLIGSGRVGESKGASDEELQQLITWRFKEDLEESNRDKECCICLANYRDKEQIRELPCQHLFHQTCVDHWLRIISCCPLCKQTITIT